MSLRIPTLKVRKGLRLEVLLGRANLGDGLAAPRGVTHVNAVILAGTYDWGNCPLTRAEARPLVPVANRPLITYSIESLHDLEISDVVICANGTTSRLRKALQGWSSSTSNLNYVEDRMPRGPAGCVKDATVHNVDEDCIVIEGAVVPDTSLKSIVTAHQESGAALTVGVEQSPIHASGGAAFVTSTLGVYMFSPEALAHISSSGYQDIKEQLLPKLRAAGERVQAYTLPGIAPRVTGPESYLAVNGWMLDQMAQGRWPIHGYRQCGESFLHSEARVSPSARLAGPVCIGPRSVIRDDAVLIGPTTIGADCDLGAGSVICFSAIWDGVTIGERACIDESILARGVHIPPKTKLLNRVWLPEHE